MARKQTASRVPGRPKLVTANGFRTPADGAHRQDFAVSLWTGLQRQGAAARVVKCRQEKYSGMQEPHAKF